MDIDPARPTGPGPDHPPSRVRVVQGSHNLRDLGGLTGAGGRTVRTGLIWRGDYPAFADVDEGAQVRALGLRSVVDLRRGTEAAVETVAWQDHGVAYVRCPLSAGGESSWHARYAAYLDHRPETVVAAVRHVMAPAAHPVLFHCAAGKDRTGVVAALVLLVLGVDEEDVVADYVLTEAALTPVLSRLRGIEPYATMLAGDGDEAQRPRASNMRSLITWLADRGGARQWLQDHGVPPEELDAFCAAVLVEPAAARP